MVLTSCVRHCVTGLFLLAVLLLALPPHGRPVLAGAAQPPACSLSAASSHFPGAELAAGQRHMGIRMLGSLRLENVSCRSLPLMGLSGLAWSADTGLLYAVSDRGNLFHLRPIFADGMLVDLVVNNAYPLRGKNDQPLDIEAGDSEGLAIVRGNNGIRDDEELLVSFERQPRISRYRPWGLWLGDTHMSDSLENVKNYDSSNRSLESVALHPEHGILTAPELPLKEHPDNLFRIYDQNGVIAGISPADEEYGAITDLTVAPDGNLLLFERIFPGVFGVLAAVIHRIQISNDAVETNILVRLDTDRGHLIDSFEGITHHRGNHYFLVSDDNGIALQRTLLFYLAIIPDS